MTFQKLNLQVKICVDAVAAARAAAATAAVGKAAPMSRFCYAGETKNEKGGKLFYVYFFLEYIGLDLTWLYHVNKLRRVCVYDTNQLSCRSYQNIDK